MAVSTIRLLAVAIAYALSARAFTPHLAFQTETCFSKSSRLNMVKRSERAFIEKNLEDAMNNDWRVFRARLVAQERAQEIQEAAASNNNKKKDAAGKANKNNQKEDPKLAKQGDLGDMFADAISSIFHKKQNDAAKAEKHDIFDGDTVGGLSVPEGITDPFVSHEELPILMEPTVKIDKHRWAHTIPHVEPGCVLVANEKLGGVFHQTVVLVVDHCESQGSTGIIINR